MTTTKTSSASRKKSARSRKASRRKVPALRHHKASGQGLVRLLGAGGARSSQELAGARASDRSPPVGRCRSVGPRRCLCPPPGARRRAERVGACRNSGLGLPAAWGPEARGARWSLLELEPRIGRHLSVVACLSV